MLATGVDVCRELKTNSRTTTPVAPHESRIAPSSLPVEAGIDEFLNKPLDLAEPCACNRFG
jgi:DNA-binding response OmpR family regulator